MQVYVFTVVVMGDDVQDAAEEVREHVIDFVNNDPDIDVHVTESVRATGD